MILIDTEGLAQLVGVTALDECVRGPGWTCHLWNAQIARLLDAPAPEPWQPGCWTWDAENVRWRLAAIPEGYADWMAARAPRLEAEDALALAHFQGKNNLLRRLNALKRADFSHHADRIRCPVQIICASDDLLVPSACSSELHAALPDSQKMVMRYGGHACNVTDPETFNALLLNGLASLLHHREAAL